MHHRSAHRRTGVPVSVLHAVRCRKIVEYCAVFQAVAFTRFLAYLPLPLIEVFFFFFISPRAAAPRRGVGQRGPQARSRCSRRVFFLFFAAAPPRRPPPSAKNSRNPFTPHTWAAARSRERRRKRRKRRPRSARRLPPRPVPRRNTQLFCESTNKRRVILQFNPIISIDMALATLLRRTSTITIHNTLSI